MVAEICRDIAALDNAKRNLTAAITALKRLQMLVRFLVSVSLLRCVDITHRMFRRVVSLNCATYNVEERKWKILVRCARSFAVSIDLHVRFVLVTTKAARCWVHCSCSLRISPIIATSCWCAR
jgi:hypothetical protein